MPATAAVKDTPKVGYSTDERLLATRYKQGGRTVYSVALSPGEIVNLIHRPDPDAKNPGNRQIRPNHASAFANYYLEHDKWVIPGIILRAPGIFGFEETVDAGDGSAMVGVLSYPKRQQGDIQILDGQHRILGFHIALDKISKQIEDARDQRARALRTEGGVKTSPLVKEAEKNLREAERKRDRLYAERVSVEIQVTDHMQEYRQMFFDIADNALGITASVKARFDTRKVVNRALPAVLEHPLLVNRVDMEIDRLSRKSPDLVSARHVTEIIRSLTVGIDGRVGKVMEKTLNDIDVANKTTAFLNMLTEAFPPLKAVELGQLLPEQIRQTSLLGSPLMLRVLAGTYFELKTMHGFSDQMILDYFKALAPHMVAPIHENTIWWRHAPAETFDLGGYSPNGRRQDSAALTKALWEWAVDKEKFVYAEPQPAPEPEPDEDELPIDYSDLGDANLAARLQAEDEAAGVSKPARTKS